MVLIFFYNIPHAFIGPVSFLTEVENQLFGVYFAVNLSWNGHQHAILFKIILSKRDKDSSVNDGQLTANIYL